MTINPSTAQTTRNHWLIPDSQKSPRRDTIPTNCAAKWTNDFRLADAVAFIRSILPAGTALVSDFPIGHGAERRAVPFGVEAELTVGEGRAHLASVGALLEGGLSS